MKLSTEKIKEIEDEINETIDEMAERRRVVREMKRKDIIGKLAKQVEYLERTKAESETLEETRDRFAKAKMLQEHLEKEISRLRKKMERRQEVLNGIKAMRQAGINGVPRNQNEMLFVFGFFANRIGFEHVVITQPKRETDWKIRYTATLDGREVSGIIQRLGEACDGTTVCWRRKRDAEEGKYVELSRYLTVDENTED